MDLHLKVCRIGDLRYVQSRTSEQFITSSRDFLDLLAWGYEHGSHLFMLEESNFHSGFYDLRTGVAGDVFQKLVNYGGRMAILGTFRMIPSGKFRELISESNRGDRVRFAGDQTDAIRWLTDDANIRELTR